MVIFNTNQARHLYVAASVGQIAADDVNTDATSGMSNGQLKVGAIKNGDVYEDMYFVYKNNDGIITRSDAIKIKNIEYMNWVSPDAMKTELQKITVTLDTSAFADVSKTVGKELSLTVNLREFIGLEDSENYPIVVTCTVPTVANNDTGTAAFFKLFEDARNGAIASFATAPFAVSSSKDGLVITQTQQKWARGKLSADPIHFEVFTSQPITGEPWGIVSDPAGTSTYVSGDFKVADLEYFTHRERADILGEIAWPYDYSWTPIVSPAAGTYTYGLMTIQYFYAGLAEDVQKSPRTMQIAVSAANYSTLKGYIDEFMSPATGSGAGA